MLSAGLVQRAPRVENLFQQRHDARFVVHQGLSDSDGAAILVCGSATTADLTSAQRCCHCSRSVSGNFASSNGSRTLVKAGSTCHVESGGADTVRSFIISVM